MRSVARRSEPRGPSLATGLKALGGPRRAMSEKK